MRLGVAVTGSFQVGARELRRAVSERTQRCLAYERGLVAAGCSAQGRDRRLRRAARNQASQRGHRGSAHAPIVVAREPRERVERSDVRWADGGEYGALTCS